MGSRTDDLMRRALADESHSSLSSAEEEFAGAAEAGRVYARLRAMLLDIDHWNERGLLTSFELFDERGARRAARDLAAGVFVRIRLTGTLKYDWVRVEEVFDRPDELVVAVRPCHDPTAEEPDEKVISHFFTSESRNNFCLTREEARVALRIIGVDEKMNAAETAGALETVRNAAVNLGSYLGVQRGEWEKFCHHFMNDARAAENLG